jgi:hypothetical protein
MTKTVLNEATPALPKDDFLSGVIGIVEATDFERQCLWERNHEHMTWESNLSGYLPTVGLHGDDRVVISLLTAKIDGHKVLFWHATSPIVNYTLITEWFRKNMPRTAFRPDDYLNNVDSQNFSNVFSYERDKAYKASKEKIGLE